MEKKDKLDIGLYNDYYGALLTEHQRSLVSDYYDRDMSLAEIAAERGISPQGVRDALIRAERQLEEYERKLGIVEKSRKLAAMLRGAAESEGDERTKKLLLDAADML